MADAEPTFDVDGNRLRLLTDGQQRFDALIAMIEGARTTLRLIFYIYSDDESGRRVNAALIAAAARGVEVCLIVDGFGSDTGDERFLDPVRDAGAEVLHYSPRFGRRYLLRNHQKLVLADAGDQAGARAIVGGFNVEDDYFGTVEDQAWRDLGLRIEGPAAARIVTYFDQLARWIRDPRHRIRRLNKRLSRLSEKKGALRWLIGGPTRRLSPWARAVRHDMRRARTIDIIAAYFTPSPLMIRRLDQAGRGGRQVRVVTAAKSDNNATIAAARFTYRSLLRHGVKLFEYRPTKLHTKLYVVDDAVHIGSANFDMRSLFINLELMLRIEDATFAAHVCAYVEGEIADSEPITMAVHKERSGPIQRVRQFFAYLVVAVVDPAVSRGLNFGVDTDD